MNNKELTVNTLTDMFKKINEIDPKIETMYDLVMKMDELNKKKISKL